MPAISENLDRVRLALLVCFIVCLVSVRASASMWTDPTWEQMLKDSKLIALVEVTEGGKIIAKVKPLKVFKGKSSGEFYVTGYNNQNWPREGIEAESFRQKQRYYLFLRTQDTDSLQLAILDDAARTSAEPEWKKLLQQAKNGAVWYVWTPSSGDLPVDGRNVHYSLLGTSYPDAAKARSCAEFERFLKAAIAYQVAGKKDPGLLEKTLQAIRNQSQKQTDSADKESGLAYFVSAYFLLGGRAYHEVFEKTAVGDDADARFMLARLLGSINDQRANKLLLTMLADKSSIVQGEVVRQLAQGDPKTIGQVLLDRLSSAGEGGVYPRGLMVPVRNRLDGGKIEIIRALGKLKYGPAAPALLNLLENVEDSHSLQVLLQALEEMGHQDYAKALEKPLSKEPLIYWITEWAGTHHVTALKGALEEKLDHPPEVRRDVDLSAVSKALGIIGDERSAAKLAECLDRLSSQKTAEFLDQTAAMDVIGALGALRYKPARSAVARSFFFWFGIDSAFAAKPELLKTKKQLQSEVESEAKKCFPEFRRVDAQALVFIQNRTELVNGSETTPNYSFALEVGIRSQEHPELKAAALQARLKRVFGTRQASIGVTRWLRENYGESSGGNDARLDGRNDPLYLWRWAQYVQATRDPKDLRFAQSLIDTGLAQCWGATKYVEGVFGSAPIE